MEKYSRFSGKRTASLTAYAVLFILKGVPFDPEKGDHLRKRNRQLNIRFTEDEYLKLQRNAAKTKMTVSNYVRALGNGNSPKECPPLEYHLLINEVQNYIYGLNELKEIIHFNCENGGFNSLNNDGSFEQELNKEISNFSNLLLDIRKKILLPDKAIV